LGASRTLQRFNPLLRKQAACALWRTNRIRDKNFRLNLHTAIFLFFAGALGGGINAVAGGGSFVAFPALLFTGVPPIPANATNTLALWVGTTASGGAYSRS